MKSDIDFSNIKLEELAGFIAKTFKNNGIEVILVGGACVSIYSKNCYQSYDLDFVTYEGKRNIKRILDELDFIETNGYFKRKKCPWFIEFVPPPVAIGKELIKEFKNKRTPLGTIKLLNPTDCVKDRLASFFYWDDRQGLEQAIEVCKDQKVSKKELTKWSKSEGFEVKFQFFLKKLSEIQISN